ncbi:MAG: T9SS type A sorting domain-containing protein [candidate division Zixibacteria bacterium]|nr:T9SS type A sorting domain-containing protein [candidate division Zixibacteria bacterium]
MRKLFSVILTVCLLFTAAAFAGEKIHKDKYADYLPMPLPEYKAPTGNPSENSIVVYDVNTGEETVYDMPAGSVMGDFGLADDYVGGNPDDSEWKFNGEGMVDNFTSLTRVYNQESFPYRVNCKIFMTFPYGQYVGSAALIDNNHAITAGHCVYMSDAGGWATSIELVPAYENGYAPYGRAYSTQLMSWTGWTYYENFEHDMGMIRLDRNIGNSTGYYGYGWTQYDNRYLTYTFHNPGYPAEYPYSGAYMYYWYGTFDSVTDYILYFNRAAYGGQSGSGHTVAYLGHGYTIGVVSHRSYGQTGSTRITQNKFGHIRDFIQDGILAKDHASENMPNTTTLLSNYPNPFNASTNLVFELANSANIQLDIYNLKGELVETVANGHYDAGSHSVNWNADNYASGTYFARLNVDNQTSVAKLSLLK